MTRDADIARIAAMLYDVEANYRGKGFDNAAAALYDAGLRPSVEPAGLDVERLGKAIVEHRTKFWANEPCVAECARDIAPIYALLPTQASDSPEKR